jgi:hypothetical protein
MRRAVATHLLIPAIVLAAVVAGLLSWVFVVPTKFGASKVSDISTNVIPKNRVSSEPLHVQYLEGTDGTRLAYRAYVPATPRAIVVFYHGSGANSGAGYVPIGEELSEHYNIATYLPDSRGHGLSGGARGDTRTVQQIYSDTTSLIQHIKKQYPVTPFFFRRAFCWCGSSYQLCQ